MPCRAHYRCNSIKLFKCSFMFILHLHQHLTSGKRIHLSPVNLHSLYEFHNENKFKGSNLIIFNANEPTYHIERVLAALSCIVILLMILWFHIFWALVKVLVGLSSTCGCKECENISSKDDIHF